MNAETRKKVVRTILSAYTFNIVHAKEMEEPVYKAIALAACEWMEIRARSYRS